MSSQKTAPHPTGVDFLVESAMLSELSAVEDRREAWTSG